MYQILFAVVGGGKVNFNKFNRLQIIRFHMKSLSFKVTSCTVYKDLFLMTRLVTILVTTLKFTHMRDSYYNFNQYTGWAKKYIFL